jgi:tetratricopeptide (TPR) repeat protein
MERIARLNEQPDLLAFLGTPRGYARVRAIHHLSGGNHRLHIVLSDFITRDSLDNLVRPFEAMVDEQLTPYYQERLRWISPQQRKIVEFLCQSAHPVSVKVIAERLFSDHNTITSQLKKLREFGYVTTNARGREARYELAEPLMRLSMQVKTAHDREPLDLLVNFLRVWYEREDLERRLGQLPLSAYGREYFETTLARSRSGEGNFCVELLRQELGDVDLKHCSDEQLETLRLVAEESGTHADRQALVVAYFCRKNYIGVVKHANRLLAMDNLSADITANALLFRGFAHGERQQIDEAIADCTRVIELPNVPAWVLDSAIGFRGTMFEKRGQREAAVADYTRLIELARAPANVIAETLIRRGSCWNNDQSEAAMADFTRVIEMPDVRITAVAEAFVNRGLRQDENGRCEDAMHDYTQAIELSDPPAGIVAVALFNRGRSHYGNNRYQAALADFTRLIEQPDVPIQLMARALFQRGVIHLRMDRSKDAMADFTRMIALVGTSEQELVCFAKAFMVLLRFSNDQWSEVQALLQNEATAEKAIRTFGSRFPDLFVESIFFKITSREMWNERARESVEIFARHHVLTQLGEALVRHITDLSKSPVGDSGYDQWFEGWQAAAAGRAEFDLPLRLLRVGIAYLKTNDEGSLLELPQEEREILRQALHLDQLTST